MTVENIRKLLQLKENQYKLYGNFKQKIITHSLNIINETTDIYVVIEENKKGRSVESITFYIEDKFNGETDMECDITQLIDKVFIDNSSIKYLIMSYEQNKDNKKEFRFKVFQMREQKITYTPWLSKEKLYNSIIKLIRETEMIKKLGVKL
jgi:hypothetical protein